ncbi:hypothetical protein [Methylobacterium sp. 190mf]|uniref:hypothetical protein n=1 Tax=Methylobacterium sp. 190mf TaxID=1761798 RepID=UPI0011B07835|nr:hypothetical protein [Methylobacterium sp. 190mf]
MPPRSMFQGKRRPSGMEFPCCANCNNGTSAADLVAGFLARISPEDVAPDWKMLESYARIDILEKKAPGVIAELFNPSKITEEWVPNSIGILRKKYLMKMDGPLVQAYLDIFAAKFGMALYREHCKTPIPVEGGVQSAFFLNAGLSQKTADKILADLPDGNTLIQGERNSVHEQFFYRYNTDNRSIVGALAGFHDGLYVLTIAFSNYEAGVKVLRPPQFRLVRPGQLATMMPKPPTSSSIILPRRR